MRSTAVPPPNRNPNSILSLCTYINKTFPDGGSSAEEEPVEFWSESVNGIRAGSEFGEACTVRAC